LPLLNAAQIRELIPHRDPFLWIDEVVEASETRVVARKRVDPELELFRGHYPGKPILPGVILCEAVMQAGAILIARLPGGQLAPHQVPVATRLNNVKFKHMVRPGDELELEAVLTERMAHAYFLTGKVRSNGKLAAQLDFVVTAAEMPE
jgi:3-hydroxyacyl-[acyl-carrier-protein] dehydratase